MSWFFPHVAGDSDSDSGLIMWGQESPSDQRLLRRNPPAIKNTVEVDADAPVKKFGSFRIANQRLKKVSLKTPLVYDHTYNAVSFNVRVKKDADKYVFVTGFEASGLLQEMSIYKLVGKDVNRHIDDIHLWKLIHKKFYPKSWNKPSILRLEEPVRIGPGETCGFYIHSNCDNGNGLKYRSCLPGIVLEDECIQVLHGWAHTSCIPFDLNRGWIRNHRVLSGSIFYEPAPFRWSPDCNVFWQDKSSTYQLALDAVMSTKYFSTVILVEVMSFCGMDWFNPELVASGNDHGKIVQKVKDAVSKNKLQCSKSIASMMDRISGALTGMLRSRSIGSNLPTAPQQANANENLEDTSELKENQNDSDESDGLQIFVMRKKRTI